MSEMIDILDFLIHIDRHGGNNFSNIIGSLLIVLSHLSILLEYSLGHGF